MKKAGRVGWVLHVYKHCTEVFEKRIKPEVVIFIMIGKIKV